jgi:hypothetical protein
MNTGRLATAAIFVFVARALGNFLFYGLAMRGQYEALMAAHPGIFREVLPAYLVLDLIAAALFVYLFAKAGAAFGGGVKGGVVLGIVVALLSPVVGLLYTFFSVTYYSQSMVATEVVYQLVAYAVQGAVAGAVYKS